MTDKVTFVSTGVREIPLATFQYCDRNIIDRLYAEPDGDIDSEFPAGEPQPTEAWLNNPERIAREAAAAGVISAEIVSTPSDDGKETEDELQQQ